MAIACPNCDHKLALKSPRPGRFRPDCPVCRKPFVITVAGDDGATLKVRALSGTTGLGTKRDAPATVAAPPAAADTLGPGACEIVLEPVDPASAGQDALAFSVALPDSGPASGVVEPPAPPARPVVEVKGYTIERELGRGGMGTVYLARQLSLDRYVALKVMSKRWATDPVFVARFTREAYAAAQLAHPNIVQIHDMGEAGGTRYFSMEYVPGRTLADLVKARGKLDTETAVGYVLQAARGLKHAHDRGLIHRDVKPDNLLLDDHGSVKVSDLGLVKTPATRRADDAVAGADAPPAAGLDSLPADMTGARIALGTPAYMSPEQCRDAAAVDHRADIYSLGCTLYVLVTGRQPFSGTTAVELMTKHAYEPLVPPEHIVARVPREVSEVIQRMMAKEADDRFQSMGEVVQTLEAWLGIRRAGSFSPGDDQINRLEGYVHRFNHAPAAVLRRRVVGGFFSSAALAAVLVLFFGNPVWALGLAGLVVQATLAYFVLDGVARRGFLFTRTRQFLAGLTWGDRVVGVAALALFGVLLAMLQAFWIWVGFGLIGVGLAFALRLGIDRQAEEEEREPVEACQRFLRRLREQGLDEDEVRHFVAKFAGRHWEAFFEALFGFEAKLAARAVLLRGGTAGVREKYAAWREPLVAVMDRVEKARREARERELLRAVGLAELLAAHAPPQGPASAPPTDAGRRQNPFDHEPPRDASSRLVNLFVGVHVRAAAAAFLIAACALWVHQTAVAPAAGAQSHGHSLEIAGIPGPATTWVDGWNVGVAGLLLVASLLYRGNVMAVLALLGAAVAAVGHQCGIRTVEPFRAEHVGLMLGFVLALVGFRAGR